MRAIGSLHENKSPAHAVYLEFTIDLGDRSADRPAIGSAEAEAMLRLGFRFSLYEPDSAEFALSLPYTTVWNIARGRLTFRQER